MGRHTLSLPQGAKFGKLTVLGIGEPKQHPRGGIKSCSRVKCDCGKEANVLNSSVRNGRVRSCGCLKSKPPQTTTHGLSKTRAYFAWKSMMRRCYEPTDANYRRYGGRGIRVCIDWHDAAVFVRDMGQPAIGMTLDRIDNDAGYSAVNCRWTDMGQQNANRSTNVFVVLAGARIIFAEAARRLGKRPDVIQKHVVRKGISHQGAIDLFATR